MTSTVDASPTHPIVDFTARVNDVLEGLTEAPAWSLTTQEQRNVVVGLTRALSRIDEMRLRVLAAGDRADLGAETAASSTTAWLAHATRVPAGQAHADVRLATALDTDLVDTRAALAAGTVNTDQARVITTAVAALPETATTADPTLAGRAEKHLLDLAAVHDARVLRRLARHVLHVLDPDAADQALGRRLEAEERAAAAATSLVLHDNGDGSHSGRFTISDLHAAMLTTSLEAFTNPTCTLGEGATAESDAATQRRPRPELLGQAFGELLERLDATRLPTAGGVNATVVVMVGLDTLLTGLGTAQLDTGQRISASLARRLACEAGVIPAVVRRLVDGASVVLDMGRRRRLHTEAQRIALTIEQQGCTAEGCTRPSAWCQAHHDTAWATGGSTSVANGRLLCPFHHLKAHSPHYGTTHLPGGRVAFYRRT
jgi:hypothetical protein